MKQIPGTIYLADQRGQEQSAIYQRYCTFNFGGYSSKYKQPFGSLRVLNEEMLAAAGQMDFQADQASHVLLLPITGSLLVTDAAGNTQTADVGQALVHSLPTGSRFVLTNPYSDHWIHFLQIWFSTGQPTQSAFSQVFTYEEEALDNQLSCIIDGESGSYPFSLSLGRFAGRQETIYTVNNPTASLFTFVLSGAFEVEGRLLHEKDGLALWDTETMELEALSEHALLLVWELH
jgi:quercetin 2,3-dioxygenase